MTAHNSLLPHTLRFRVAHPYNPQLRPLTNDCPTRKFFLNENPINSLSLIFTNLKKGELGLVHSCSGGIFRSTYLSSTYLTHLPTGEPHPVPQNHNSSAKHHIPQGHIPNMIPNLTEISKRLIVERDALRSSSPSDPHI